jgi:predicted alpha/beta-fold hydrolase
MEARENVRYIILTQSQMHSVRTTLFLVVCGTWRGCEKVGAEERHIFSIRKLAKIFALLTYILVDGRH